MKRGCLLLLSLLCLTMVSAVDFSLESTNWYNRGDTGTNEDMGFTIYPQSGDDPERLTVKLDNSDRIILRYNECNIYKDDYQFCYTNRRFEPENDYGIIVYERDTYYYQVEVEAYHRPMEVLQGASLTRTISKTEALVDEEIDVTLTLANNNPETGIYGMSLIELIPGDAKISDLSTDWNDGTLVWDGNLLAGESIDLTYTISFPIGGDYSLEARAQVGNDTDIHIENISIQTQGFYSYNITGDLNASVGELISIDTVAVNLVGVDNEIDLTMTLPREMRYKSGHTGKEKRLTSGAYERVFSSTLEAEGQTQNWTTNYEILDYGNLNIPYTIVGEVAGIKESFSGEITITIPFTPLQLFVDEYTDFFSPGEESHLVITLANKDASATFSDIKIEVETDVETVEGTERAFLDVLAPDTTATLVDARLTMDTNRQYAYTVKVSYTKGTEREVLERTLQFFPNPTENPTQIDSEEQTSSSEGGAESDIDTGNVSQLHEEAVIVEDTIGSDSPGVSISTIFLIAVIVLAIVAGLGVWFFHRPRSGHDLGSEEEDTDEEEGPSEEESEDNN